MTATQGGRVLPMLIPLLALPVAITAFWWMAAPTREGRNTPTPDGPGRHNDAPSAVMAPWRAALGAVLAAEGKPDEAARIIDQDITNRTDNPDEAPQDLSERSAALAQKARWLKRDRVA